jgi:hypothetical protein
MHAVTATDWFLVRLQFLPDLQLGLAGKALMDRKESQSGRTNSDV